MQQKTDRLHLRVEPETKRKLQEEADELGVSVSELVRIRCAREKARLDREMYQRIERAIARAMQEALGGI